MKVSTLVSTLATDPDANMNVYLLELGHRACDPPVRTLGRVHIIFESKVKPEFAPIGECVISPAPNGRDNIYIEIMAHLVHFRVLPWSRRTYFHDFLNQLIQLFP